MAMRQTRSFCRMMSLVLVMALLAGGALVPSAAMALTKKDCGFFRGINAAWFYVPSTVTDSAELTEWFDWAYFEHNGGSEFATKCEIEFVSGDEELKDALQYRTYPSSYYTGGEAEDSFPMMDIYVDNSQLTTAGEATFHVTVESDHYTDEGNVTLHVINWDEQPLVLTKGGSDVLTAQLGEIIENKTMATVTADIREDEIIADFAAQGIEIGEDLRVNPAVRIPQETTVVARWSNGANYAGDYREGLKAVECGRVDVDVHYDKGNVVYETQVQIIVPDYWITGPKAVRPGESVQYAVMDDQPEESRSFDMSIDGKGVTLDRKTLTVTAAKDAKAGETFTLTATPSDGREPVTFTGKVSAGVIAQEEFEIIEYREGFSIPRLSDDDIYKTGVDQNRGWLICETKDTTGPSVTSLVFALYGLAQFAEDGAVAREIYEKEINTEELNIMTDEIIEIGGHPARIVVADTGSFSQGLLYYARNNRMIIAEIDSFPTSEESAETLPMVTAEDMKAIAERIGYDAAKASITVDDGAITIQAKGDTTTLSGGKKLQMTAAFANQDKVNKKNQNDTVEWTVTDTTTGKAPEDVKIDAKGSLSADKALSEVRKVEVTASSPIFHTSAKYPVTVLPAVTSFKIEPTELFFYNGTAAQTVKARLEPATVPPEGITWTAKQEGIVEITDNKDGTATIKPLAAGKTTVTAAESGGKRTDLKITVQEPVTGLTLEAEGKNYPGGSVMVRENVAPKEAGNKKVEWSLDVGEDIARIKQGLVKISKNAPIGTVITVTCTAPGAPEPVTASVQIRVEEKK